MAYVEQVLESLKDCYLNESEFHQAATEILTLMHEAIEVFQNRRRVPSLKCGNAGSVATSAL